MERYEKYKKSKVYWIKELPDSWEQIKISRIFQSIGSGTTPSSGNNTYYTDDGYYWLQSGDFKDNLIYDTQKKISQTALDIYKLTIYPKDSIVVAMYGASIGKVGYLKIPTSVNQACCVLHKSNIINPRYAFYSFILEKNNLISKSKGGTQPNISQEIIKGHYLLVPPLREQEKIVRFLDEKTAKIDSYVADKEKEIQLLNELKESVIANVVTQGLNPNVKMKESGISWIGMIPEHWEVKRVASLFTGKIELNTDFRYQHAFKFNYGTLVPKEEVGDVEEYRSTYVKYSLIKKNDILINGLNLNYDFVSQRVAIAPEDGIITSAYIVVRPRENTNSAYYTLLFKTMDNKKLFHGMGTGIRLTLSFEELKKQVVVEPPLEEQRAIVAHIENKCSKINSLISELEAEIEYLKEYKQRLIADCVTGQINVQNQ